MAELGDKRARAEAQADAELDRRRQRARVKFLRAWVAQNGVGVVSSTLRVGEAEIDEAVDAGELLEGSPAYRAVEGWMAGTGYWEMWDGMAEDGGEGEGEAGEGDGGGEAASAGYPSVAVFFGRGMEAVSDARSRQLMRIYEESGGDLAVALDMSGLSRNQYMQAARRIKAGGELSGRIADLIDARIEELRVARGGGVEVEKASERAAERGPAGEGREARDGVVEGVETQADSGVEAEARTPPPAPAPARGGGGGRRGVASGGGVGWEVDAERAAAEEDEEEREGAQPREAVGDVRLPLVLGYEGYADEAEFYGADVARLARRWRAEWVALRVYRRRPGPGYQYRYHRRVLELELELMEKYGLTVPPDEVEITGVQREDAIRWRRQRLAELGPKIAAEEAEGRAPRYIAPYPERRAKRGWWGRWRRPRRGAERVEPRVEPEVVEGESEGVRSFAGQGRWRPLPWPELQSDEVEARVTRVKLRMRDTERLAAADAPRRGQRHLGWTAEEMRGATPKATERRARRGWFRWLKR